MVRTEGQVERSSRSIYLVAEVDADADSGGLDRRAGYSCNPAFLSTAGVEGITLKEVFRVPLAGIPRPGDRRGRR